VETRRLAAGFVMALALTIAGIGGCGRGEEKSKGKPGGNRAPKARLEVSRLVGLSGLTGIDFDASFSSDDVNLTEELARRWDFDGDGTWDTGLSRSSRTTHVYDQAGRFRPRLLVIDSGGLADSIVGPELEIRAPCPPPDFALTDINPHSRSFQQRVRLSELRGRPVLAWFVAPTK
jgi:hypothetical protein